jgi:hypothetical protein
MTLALYRLRELCSANLAAILHLFHQPIVARRIFVNCRNIVITLIHLQKGEQTAQACANA